MQPPEERLVMNLILQIFVNVGGLCGVDFSPKQKGGYVHSLFCIWDFRQQPLLKHGYLKGVGSDGSNDSVKASFDGQRIEDMLENPEFIDKELVQCQQVSAMIEPERSSFKAS